MPQLNFEGEEEEPISEKVMRVIHELAQEGWYTSKDVARACLARDIFPPAWRESVELKAATLYVEEVSKRRNSAGLSQALSMEKPHQFRLRDWCNFEEKLFNLRQKLVSYTNDGHAIRLDASAIMKEHPKERAKVLAMLPAELRPSDK